MWTNKTIFVVRAHGHVIYIIPTQWNYIHEMLFSIAIVFQNWESDSFIFVVVIVVCVCVCDTYKPQCNQGLNLINGILSFCCGFIERDKELAEGKEKQWMSIRHTHEKKTCDFVFFYNRKSMSQYDFCLLI